MHNHRKTKAIAAGMAMAILEAASSILGVASSILEVASSFATVGSHPVELVGRLVGLTQVIHTLVVALELAVVVVHQVPLHEHPNSDDPLEHLQDFDCWTNQLICSLDRFLYLSYLRCYRKPFCLPYEYPFLALSLRNPYF